MNKLKHIETRNVRFGGVDASTNVHSEQCVASLRRIGVEKPGLQIARCLQVLHEIGVLTYEDFGDFDSVLPLGVLNTLWEGLFQDGRHMAAAA